jgi:hypothetical protein
LFNTLFVVKLKEKYRNCKYKQGFALCGNVSHLKNSFSYFVNLDEFTHSRNVVTAIFKQKNVNGTSKKTTTECAIFTILKYACASPSSPHLKQAGAFQHVAPCGFRVLGGARQVKSRQIGEGPQYFHQEIFPATAATPSAADSTKTPTAEAAAEVVVLAVA